MKKMLRVGIAAIRAMGGRPVIKFINRSVRRVAGITHFIQYAIEWGARPVPGWFDHNISLYYSWHRTRDCHSWERGVFSLLAMKEGANVLELCCGGGFNSYYFYSIRAGKVTALDYDAEAIGSARKNYKAGNLQYLVADIRHQIPEEMFDNIVMDASLEYFTESEITDLMKTLKAKLAPAGVVSGYSIVQQVLETEWKLVFKEKDALLRFLQPHFANVRIFETTYPSRHNLYFFAGDGELPFDTNWAAQTVWRRAESTESPAGTV